MTNQVTANGLQTDTLDQIITRYQAQLRTIYGDDINLEQDTPDGQQSIIIPQMAIDILESIRQVFNSMDPDQAIGRVLDQRVNYNGIKRRAGTRSLISIDITYALATVKPLNGMETDDPFIIADDEGTQWVLLETESLAGVGVYNFIFTSMDVGKIQASPNTIVNQVTVVTGISSVTNPTVPFSYGIDEESDQDLKKRRQRSVAIASRGYADALQAALENISGVNSAKVHENKTSVVDIYGQLPHSIWVIVSGTYDDEEVARAIYSKRGGGENMNGEKSYLIPKLDGTLFEINWDDVEEQDLFIQITVNPINTSIRPDIDGIRNGLPSILTTSPYETLNTNMLTQAVNQIDPNSLVIDSGFSEDSAGPYINIITPTTKKDKFSIKSENVIILPMGILPINPTVEMLGIRQFAPKGGYGTYIYSLPTNESGGSIDVNGLYTAGNTDGTDVVRAVDQLGNQVETNVTVI